MVLKTRSNSLQRENSLPQLPLFEREKQLLIAEPTAKGFWGLNQMYAFLTKTFGPFCESAIDKIVVVDFSGVRIWDISALLWLVIAFEYYTRKCNGDGKNLQFLLRLPEASSKGTQRSNTELKKSADFLRRWKFDDALRNLAQNPEDLLVPEQRDYFVGGPREFYQHPDMIEDRVLSDFVSRNLVEIRNLANVKETMERKIDDGIAANCRTHFCKSGVEKVLEKQCGIPEGKAQLFSKHLLNEGVLNVQQHPQASIGMVSVSILGRARRLILAMVDNGEPIPKTIYGHYHFCKRKSNPRAAASLPNEYDREKLTPELLADIITHATLQGTSRKLVNSQHSELDLAREIGMGLYYIRNDTTSPHDFKGELTIASAGVSVRYLKPATASCSSYDTLKHYGYPWEGNLLRISFPLTLRACTKSLICFSPAVGSSS